VKIRPKTLLILLLTTLILMSTIYEVSQKVMLDSISISENNEAETNAQRFNTNLNIALQGINSTANDWASWDDTYQFIENNNTAYIDSNLPDETLIHLGLSLILFINQSRQLVFGKTFDLENQIPINLQADQISQITNNNFLYTNDTSQSEGGLILFGETPMLVISQPILTSSDEGPIRGALIMGRFLDKLQSNLLKKALGLSFEICVLGTSQMPVDFQLASNNLSPEKPIFAQVTNETNISGYVLLQDLSGASIAIIKVDSYRSAYTQAKTGLNYLLISFVILGIAIFSVTTILLDKFVLSRVSRLTNDITKIGPKSIQQNYVIVKGNDEISNLASKINGMITAVQDSHDELKKYSESLENKVEERTLELKKSQEKLKSIFAASPDTILAIDLQNNIAECNKEVFESSGYSRNDLIGRQASSFLSETDYKRIFKIVEKNKANKSSSHLECNIIKKDKSVYPAELTVGPLQDAQGIPSGFVVMIRDLTEKKELERKLFDSQRLAAIGELAGMVGHDLRNPLAAIKNAVYFLKKKGASIQQEQAKTMLETIDRSIIHSDKIINDLLEYAGNMRLELQSSVVCDVLINALSFVKIPENVTIINNVSEEVSFKVDRNKIERVFINLVKNAADALPNGGTVTLSCKQVNGNVEITCVDTGVGIPEEIRSKLFSPLITTKAQGMGFGLAICKRIVEAHGGTITVETEEGKDTTFKVTLPVDIKQEEKEWSTAP
jgi:PAS domain S-box-containing protein